MYFIYVVQKYIEYNVVYYWMDGIDDLEVEE